MMKKLTAVLLALCLLLCLCVGCSRRSSSDGPSREGSSSSRREEPESSRSEPSGSAPVASLPEDEPEPESPSAPEEPVEEPPASDPSAPDAPASQPSPSGSDLLQPPAVPHGAEVEELDLSAMDKSELTALLQPVLDKAGFFCKFGLGSDDRLGLGIQVDFSPEEALEVPYRDFGFNRSFYPCLNLPYRTMEELRQDMLTVFAPDVLENHLQNVLDNYIDHEGRLYTASSDGYSTERRWKLDELQVVTAGKDRLTISAPVAFAYGPTADEYFTGSLSFEVRDGYLVMDGSYFASNAS